MWLLSNEGDFLGGKRIWLSPDTEHLFGRGKDHSGPNCYIYPEQKSFSRKHLVIKVKRTQPDAAGRPDRKSEVVLEDLGSKFGTEVDGEKFAGSEKVLGPKTQDKEVHIIKMGQCKDLWKLEWHPVNITVTSHKTKKRKTTLANSQEMQDLFESCDIKFTERYQPQHTTHVIASKRNTPKGLQALVSGKWIVTSEWLDALERQISKPEVAEGEEQQMSPLAVDFDANWPNEAAFIPNASLEPVKREAVLFKPNPDRESVFKGYTFVFSDETQYSHLGPVVEQGSGKALFYELNMELTRPEDVVRYIKSVAGESGLGEFEDGSEGKGVVLVRPNDDDIGKARFCQTVDIILGQRSIRQSDFLDAIVMIDATPLRKALEESLGEGSTPFATPRESEFLQSSVPPQLPPSTEPPPETRAEQLPARRRGFRRAVTTSRFTGFDTFDPAEESGLPPPPPDNDDSNSPVGQFVPREPSPVESQLSAPSRHVFEAPAARGRKRPHQDDEVIESVEDRASKVDKLFPASAAMKRRRKELGLQGSSGEGTSVTDETQKTSKKPSFRLPFESREKQDVEEINVQQLTKERMEKEEEQREKDEEALREALEGIDIESIKSLAKVEVMEVKPRKDRLGAGDENTDSTRWKAEWNGRMNFKKFRKRRPGSTNEEAPLRGRKVIVGLEEVKKTDTTILGDDWFAEADRGAGRRRGSHATILSTGSRLLASRDGDSDEDELLFRRRGIRSDRSESQHSGPAKSISTRPRDDVEMQDVDPEEIAGEPRNERIAVIAKDAQVQPKERVRSSFTSDRSRIVSQQQTQDSGSQSQTIVGDSVRPSTANSTASSRGKRPAMGPPNGSREPLSKRSAGSSVQSTTQRAGGEEEDSGDELRFRRRRK